MIKGLVNKINDITVLGSNAELTPKIVGKISWSPVPGLVYVNVPRESLDEYVTVLRLKLDGPLKLYQGHGGLN